jgi:hypothetical protein
MACILATARNEGAYLTEWIAHHRAIGFEHIFLYTNDNTDGSDDLLRLLADAGIISWFRNQVQPDTLPQHRAYGHALSVMPDILDYRWTMIVDIDEFAAFDTRTFHSMPDYILWQEQRRADAIALSWKLHVALPNDVWRDRPSTERFPLRETALDPHVKMIFRTNRAWNANPHHPEPCLGGSFVYRSERGARAKRCTLGTMCLDLPLCVPLGARVADEACTWARRPAGRASSGSLRKSHTDVSAADRQHDFNRRQDDIFV